MKTIILNPELFIKHKSKIGIMLYPSNDSSKVNFFTGYEHLILNPNQIQPATLKEIENAVTSDDYLRELAEDHNLIEIQEEYQTENYMEYYSEFN